MRMGKDRDQREEEAGVVSVLLCVNVLNSDFTSI